MKFGNREWWTAGITAVVLVAGASWYGLRARADEASAPQQKPSAPAPASAGHAVDLSEQQARAITVGRVALHSFRACRTAVGSVDFDEDLTVQVFPPYQGKILRAWAEVGQRIAKGQTLYTIDSPDLVQAESTLIAAAGVADLTSAALVRARNLQATQGMAEKDVQQAVSDQQTAEGALKAARDAVRIFGKSEAQIDAIVRHRVIDPVLVVPSPIEGEVTARAAQPGLLVQPGSAPAPYVVADATRRWLLANVPEADAPGLKLGQDVRARVEALPQLAFNARISVIGASVDPVLHTLQVRTVVTDPEHRLHPGMLASFDFDTGEAMSSPGVPPEGVVREGDGTYSVWITRDRRHFTRLTVRIGQQQPDFDQVLDGLQEGDEVVTRGAVLLSNMLDAPPTD